MSVVLAFPGQGEQRPGMLHRLPAGSSNVLETASAVLGVDVLDCDTPEALAGTRAAQVALLVCGVAWARAVRPAVAPAFVAGHSVGLWGAAVTAGSLDLADAVRLVDLRGRLMAEVAPADSGMLAVDGLPAEQVASAADAARERGAQVWASNVNAPLRSTVSGAGRDLEAFEAVLRGLGARRVTRLSVAAPAHTPLMAPVETALRDALSRVRLAAPSLPVAGNVTGRTLTTADALRDDLARSVSRGLRWDVGTAILAERGADVWVQVPPGRALLGLLPDDATGLALEDLGLDETAARVRAATLR